MRFSGFIDAVAQRSGLPPEQADAVARAVLVTMAERVTGTPADPAGQLPDELGAYLTGPTDEAAGGTVPAGEDPGGTELGGAGRPATAGPAEFLRVVGERAGVDPATARTGTGAVFATLREAVTVDEFREMVTRLPRDPNGGIEPVPPPSFGG
ncbi:DUF2267 domain-containing protein [Micromonospora sp. GCM10011542]|uniref:DUF2267 domain-containing protein n=1 Tax=Micromonospora sp. GCM10011542 TaxID=3317337 RepID=UPI00361B29D4